MGLYYNPPNGSVVNFNFTANAYSAPSGSATNFDFEPPVATFGRKPMPRGILIRMIPFWIAVATMLWL